jgi:hypothetical protein
MGSKLRAVYALSAFSGVAVRLGLKLPSPSLQTPRLISCRWGWCSLLFWHCHASWARTLGCW